MRFVRLPRFTGAALLGFGLCALPNAAMATPILSTSTNSDGSKYAITYSLESISATEQIFDITLWADTSGNNIPGGPHLLDAVAVGINLAGGSVDVALDGSPTGDWVGEAGGLSNGGCTGNGAFICAHAGTQVPTLSAILYTWTWDVHVPLNFVFPTTGGVKVSYSDVNGHNVSDDFTFQSCADCTVTTLAAVPEPATLALLGTGLSLAGARLRRRKA